MTIKNTIENICRAEGITSVKDFRIEMEHWFLGAGDILRDDDHEPETKQIYSSHTYDWWRNWYSALTDEDIAGGLASDADKQQVAEAYRLRAEQRKAKAAAKPDWERDAEDAAEVLLRDAGCEYDPDKPWEENIRQHAENPKFLMSEIKRGWGGARAGAGRKKGSKGASMEVVYLRLPPDLVAELDRGAAELGMSRAQYIRHRLRAPQAQ